MHDLADTKKLLDILNTLCGQLSQLYKTLQQEETALAENNFKEIEALAATKNKLTSRVNDTEQTRRNLCSKLNIKADIDGIQAYTRKIDHASKVAIIKLWQRVTLLGQHCSTQNQVNGIMVAHQQRHAREALNILRGHFGASNSYSEKGAQESDQPGHTLGKV